MLVKGLVKNNRAENNRYIILLVFRTDSALGIRNFVGSGRAPRNSDGRRGPSYQSPRAMLSAGAQIGQQSPQDDPLDGDDLEEDDLPRNTELPGGSPSNSRGNLTCKLCEKKSPILKDQQDLM